MLCPAAAAAKNYWKFFFFFIQAMPRHARHAKAIDDDGERVGGKEEKSGRQWRLQANKSEGQRRGRLLCALVFRGRIDW